MDLIKFIIDQLGGNYEKNVEKLTHYIVSNKKIKKDNKRKLLINCHYVNIKWLFDSFFYYKKMDETDDEYKIIL